MINNELYSEIIEWDVANWSSALDFWKKNTKISLSSAYALEIGARHGGLSLWAALNDIKIICSDMDGPSEKAILKHKKYGVSEKIAYQTINATEIPYTEKFDLVLFKSVLGGVGIDDNKANQEKAINEIYKSLKPGGELWFAENLTSTFLHQFSRKKFLHRSKSWRYVSINEMKEFLQCFSFLNYKTVGFLGTFGRNHYQRNLLAKIDKYIFNTIIPENWRYIMIGIARK